MIVWYLKIDVLPKTYLKPLIPFDDQDYYDVMFTFEPLSTFRYRDVKDRLDWYYQVIQNTKPAKLLKIYELQVRW